MSLAFDPPAYWRALSTSTRAPSSGRTQRAQPMMSAGRQHSGRTQPVTSFQQISPDSWLFRNYQEQIDLARRKFKGTMRFAEVPQNSQADITTEGQLSEFVDCVLPQQQLIKDRDYVDEQVPGSFFAIQEWEGYVTKIEEGIVLADLIDLVTGEVKPSTSAEIPIDEFPDDESKYIKVGGTFRWSIGYRRSRSGQKDRISRIIFRKMPLYLQNDMDAVKK